MQDEELEYVGFWARVLASLVDSLLLMALLVPIIFALFGAEYLYDPLISKGLLYHVLTTLLPALVVILFWLAREATPGKMLIAARVVDAKTGGRLHRAQAIVRYLGYYLAAIPLCLGFLWIAFDSRKQGWHDKLAGTVVVRPRRKHSAVRFEQ